MTLEELVSGLEAPSGPAAEKAAEDLESGGLSGARRRRLRWCFALSSWFPPAAMLKGELAHALIAVGAVGAGMKLLEELEVGFGGGGEGRPFALPLLAVVAAVTPPFAHVCTRPHPPPFPHLYLSL